MTVDDQEDDLLLHPKAYRSGSYRGVHLADSPGPRPLIVEPPSAPGQGRVKVRCAFAMRSATVVQWMASGWQFATIDALVSVSHRFTSVHMSIYHQWPNSQAVLLVL